MPKPRTSTSGNMGKSCPKRSRTSPLAIRQAVADEQQIAGGAGIWRNRVVGVGVESVVNGVTALCAEPQVFSNDCITTTIGKNQVVLRDQSAKWIVIVALNA